jgi:tRNA dimethylallyltransferase
VAETIYVITGPTATGKSDLGVMVARELNGEVVSADSMQIYKYMDIGTAKPTIDEMGGIPHHMIDFVSPFSDYSAAKYVEDASRCCDDIISRGKIPIIVGGTGLYIESLISGRSFASRGENDEIREKYSRLYDEQGGESLLALLKRGDPERAAKLHPNDKRRIVRALEVLETDENSLTGHDEMTQKAAPRYNAKVIVLGFENRAILYDRINRRVDIMMERGLVDEVQKLLSMGFSGSTAMQAIGYKEICAALRGECTMDEAVDTVKRESRRYAKRQISWCKRYENALHINRDTIPDTNEVLHVSTNFLR